MGAAGAIPGAIAVAAAALDPAAPSPDLVPLLWLVAGLLVAAGIAGTIVPLIPGAPLVFLGLLLAAWIDGFRRVGWVTLTLLALLTLSAYAIDLWATRHGARRVGASGWALLGAFVGGVAGLFFALPGLLLGPFLGAFAGEYLARRDLRQAGRAGLGTWLGLFLSTAGRLALVVLMLGLFAFVYMLHA
jgi:uncharacterized protein YqgC (DUF456 family)